MISRVLLTVLLVAAGPVISSASDNSLKKCAWAMQFEIGDKIDLSSFQGTTISIKKHYSDKTAFRLGLTAHVEISNSDGTSSVEDDPTNNSEDNHRSYNLAIVIQRIHYPRPHASANFFWGLGPRADFHYSKETYQDNPVDGGAIQSNERKLTGWSLGLSGVLGVEWFAEPNVSILAEYGSSALYGNGKSTRTFTYVPGVREVYEDSSGSFNFESSSVRFGLSVYF